MQNGRYEATHKTLGTKYILRSTGGSLRLYDTNGLFIKTTDQLTLDKWYNISENKITDKPKLYDIAWWVNGKQKELIQMKASYGICVHKINELKQSSHKIGLLKPILHT